MAPRKSKPAKRAKSSRLPSTLAVKPSRQLAFESIDSTISTRRAKVIKLNRLLSLRDDGVTGKDSEIATLRAEIAAIDKRTHNELRKLGDEVGD